MNIASGYRDKFWMTWKILLGFGGKLRVNEAHVFQDVMISCVPRIKPKVSRNYHLGLSIPP